MADRAPWTSPSDLAEYAFCPRAHYYRQHRTAPETSSSAAGVRTHERRLSSERWRDEHAGAGWLALGVGLGLLALAVYLWH